MRTAFKGVSVFFLMTTIFCWVLAPQAVADPVPLWHFEMNGNLDDSMGLNNGVAVGEMIFTAGPLDDMQAVEFNFGSYANLEDIDLRDGTSGDFTIAYWSKVTTPTPYEGEWVNYNTLSNGGWGDVGNFFGSEFKPEENRIVFGYGPPLENADDDYITGEWKHHAFVYDSTEEELLIYINGELAHTYGMVITNNLDDRYYTVFGPRLAGGFVVPEDWRLAMADVRWYDVLLNEEEVNRLVSPEDDRPMLAAPGTAGFVRVGLDAGQWDLVGVSFDQIVDDMVALADVLGTVGFANGTEVVTWDGTGYEAASFFLGTWSGNLELRRGQGFWINSPVGTDLYLLGQVPEGEETMIDLPQGLQLISAPYPAAIDLNDEEMLLSVPFNGDQIFFIGDDPGYTSNAYFMGQWSGAATLEPGKGYWYSSVNEQEMLIGKPY